MKLQILVPHYKEDAEVIRPLLDSLAIQQNVDFNVFGVIICHDGEDIPDFCITENSNLYGGLYLPQYPYEIKQVHIPHGGVSAARNGALDAATADYVMFCDADDMFYNACGLWIIFKEIATGFDSLTSIFIEETRDPETKEVVYINRETDSTFVHGKIHRRQYLIDQKIRWNPNLTIHEDSFFNILCQNLSTNVKYQMSPFYLWKWRDESVCRHDPKYILKTYNNMIDSNDALIDEFLKRGLMDKAVFYTTFMIFDAYYTMNKPEWIHQENKKFRDDVEKRFSVYYAKRKDLWEATAVQDRMKISNAVRTRTVNEGMMMEAITIDAWLKKISRRKK